MPIDDQSSKGIMFQWQPGSIVLTRHVSYESFYVTLTFGITCLVYTTLQQSLNSRTRRETLSSINAIHSLVLHCLQAVSSVFVGYTWAHGSHETETSWLRFYTMFDFLDSCHRGSYHWIKPPNICPSPLPPCKPSTC